MPRILEAVVPDILRFHPEWFTDPPPEFIWDKLRDRFDAKMAGDLLKKQLEVKNRIVAAQKAALKAQLEILDAQTELNDFGAKMLGQAKGRIAAASM